MTDHLRQHFATLRQQSEEVIAHAESEIMHLAERIADEQANRTFRDVSALRRLIAKEMDTIAIERHVLGAYDAIEVRAHERATECARKREADDAERAAEQRQKEHREAVNRLNRQGRLALQRIEIALRDREPIHDGHVETLRRVLETPECDGFLQHEIRLVLKRAA